MESLVVTLNTAKKLKAAGFPQVTLLTWDKDTGEPYVTLQGGKWAAPTAQEIADQLPKQIEDAGKVPYSLVLESDDGWNASYMLLIVSPIKGWDILHEVRARTMVEALAALWLKLRETLPNYNGSKSAETNDVKDSGGRNR